MTETSEDPLEGIRHENEVTSHLLDRLQDSVDQLRSGDSVSGDVILSLIEKLEAYHHRLHGAELMEGLLPEARPVMMDTCATHLDDVARHYADEGEVLRSLQDIVANHACDDPSSRKDLADILEHIVLAERAAIAHETDYPLTCLETVLPDDARERLAKARERQREQRDRIEDTIGK